MEISCPICGDTLANSPAGLACMCGFTARNVYQAERVRAKIERAARMAGSTARVNALHDTPGARVLAVGTNAGGAAVVVGYIPATTKEA